MAGLDPAIQRRTGQKLDGAHTLALCAKGGHDDKALLNSEHYSLNITGTS
jgi:hypothetical protein